MTRNSSDLDFLHKLTHSYNRSAWLWLTREWVMGNAMPPTANFVLLDSSWRFKLAISHWGTFLLCHSGDQILVICLEEQSRLPTTIMQVKETCFVIYSVIWTLLTIGSLPRPNIPAQSRCLMGLNFRNSARHRSNEKLPPDTWSLLLALWPGVLLHWKFPVFGRGTSSYFRPLDRSYPSILHPRDFIPGHCVRVSNVCQESISQMVTLSPACILGLIQDSSMDTGCFCQLESRKNLIYLIKLFTIFGNCRWKVLVYSGQQCHVTWLSSVAAFVVHSDMVFWTAGINSNCGPSVCLYTATELFITGNFLLLMPFLC